jgi:hypothetical protein
VVHAIPFQLSKTVIKRGKTDKKKLIFEYFFVFIKIRMSVTQAADVGTGRVAVKKR